METLCSLFAGCVSLTFINLLPSIAANGTPARCLPLGPRQLQPAVTQRWSWIKDKWFCRLSAATAHGAVPGAYSGGGGAVPDSCRLPNPPRLEGAPRAPSLRQGPASCSAPAFLCSLCSGTRRQEQSLRWQCFFGGVQRGTRCDKLSFTFCTVGVCVLQSWTWAEHSNHKHTQTCACLGADLVWSCSEQNKIWALQAARHSSSVMFSSVFSFSSTWSVLHVAH